MLPNRLTSDFFSRKRNQLQKLMRPNSVALIFSNNEYIRNGDVFHKYRQDSNLYYLSGIEQSETVLLVRTNSDDCLFVTRPDDKTETWNGRKLRINEAQTISGVNEIKFIDELESMLPELLDGVDKLYLDYDFETEPEELPTQAQLFYELYIEDEYTLNCFNLHPILKEMRWVKTSEELEAIKDSVSLTAEAFDRVLQTVAPKLYEYELEAELSYVFNKNKAIHSFHPIVASGKNACTLHYEENNSVCEDGTMILFDFGAELNYYAADISRTIPVNGTYSPRQKECYQAVLEVQKQAIEFIKVGTTVEEINQKVVKLMEQKMIDLGLFSADDVNSQSKDTPMYFNYYMHGNSHSMGIDVHDIGFRDKEMNIVPGVVLTCEPGIYIKEEGIGIRIEDDILVTETGNVNLTSAIPKEIVEIESLIKNYKND